MFDLFCKSRCNEVFFDEGVAFDDALLLCLQEVQLLDDVGILLVVLSILVNVSKEPPVVEVIDGILEDGVHCLIAPEAMTEPGGEQLHWLVRGIVGGGIQFDDLHLLLSLSPAVEPCHPSIVELFDETGELLCSIIEGDGEIWEALLILLVPRWAFAKPIVVVVHPLLKCCKIGLEPLDLLPMDIISDLDSGCKSSNNGPELVRGWIRCGSEDILHRGGREGEPPGVSGGESNSHTLFGDFAHSKGIIHAKAKMSWEAVSGLFRG